ncbi:MAG: hypothetical protein VKJ46_02435, partial [Leptolyngbyaceae bacterium]|nr:hypothetical protein [Leptolyngbyaceae bacterium]
MVRALWSVCLVGVWLFWSGMAQAGALADRLAAFPQWQNKPTVEVATGDLIYPEWLAGTWDVTSQLVDLAAPFAPDVVTPGFDSNRQYLNQPVTFQVRFTRASLAPTPTIAAKSLTPSTPVIADRAFNGLNLAIAYFGKRTVLSVKVDPTSPNRQITTLRGDRRLVSVITGRATESPTPDQFITTELFKQVFRGAPQLYFNQVETTTAYEFHPSDPTPIRADQVTAVYLSPQDANYFKTGDRPVALYRY